MEEAYLYDMQIVFISVGKTQEQPYKEPCTMYASRIARYTTFSWKETADIKASTPAEMQEKEAALVLKMLLPGDCVVLLDELGKSFTSKGFAQYIEKKQLANVKRLVFILGGAHGFSKTFYATAQEQIRLSDMTMPHQLVRLVFLEQLYRAFTILHNEQYHH